MNNDKFLDALMGKMIQIVEFQTQMGLKLNDLEGEIRAIQDKVDDAHEDVMSAVNNRSDALESVINDLDIRWEK